MDRHTTEAVYSERDVCKLELIYKIYHNKMLYAARCVLKDPQEAEDAVQETWLGIANHLHKIDDVYARKTFYYLITAVRNTAINLLHKNKKWIACESIETLPDVTDSKSMERAAILERYHRVITQIEALEPLYKEVLFLHFVQEWPVKDIADFLNLKISTVKQRLVRGKKKLLERIDDETIS